MVKNSFLEIQICVKAGKRSYRIAAYFE